MKLLKLKKAVPTKKPSSISPSLEKIGELIARKK